MFRQTFKTPRLPETKALCMQLAKLCCCWMWCIITWPLCCIGSKDSNMCLLVFDFSPKSEVLLPYALPVIRSESGDALLHRSIGVVEEDEAGDPWLAVWLTADWFEAQTFSFHSVNSASNLKMDDLVRLSVVCNMLLQCDCSYWQTEFLFISPWQEQCVGTTTPSRQSLLYASCFKVVFNPFCVLPCTGVTVWQIN